MDGFKTYIPVPRKISLNDKIFHVFLSFRGRDVRKTLVDHLFQALSAAGLNVFLDTHKLKKGEIIDLSLENAIKHSAICIPIFSKGYASSAWCLKEAALILASPALIIPLFYEMEPTHVRYPQGESSPYKESFGKHYSHPDRYSREQIDGWEHALGQICSRSGWSLDMTASFEAQLVKKVVNDIIKTLDRVPLQVAKYPVGLETVKKALLQKLNLDSDEAVVKVGIWGMGGIGKTTAAKVLYNEIYGDFDAASFLFNVRDTSLTKLQGQILKDLVNYEEELQSVEKGKYLLTDRLQGIRALVVLDDVDNRVQLAALAGDWLSPGSRLLITSRDKQILKAAHISFPCIHEMRGLEESEGLQLFCWNAFFRASPIPGYEELSKRIVEACKGHPLSLEIIGAFLYDKQDDSDIDCWSETVDNIAGNRDIFKTLYISYSGLSAEEKQIFLDIACYFIGECTSSPIFFWKSMYKKVHIAINNLSMKLLIKIDEKGVFDMNDLVRDMGRIIAEEDQTRQWQTVQSSSSFNVIASNINISHLRMYKGDSRCLKTLCTPSLRYLHLEGVRIKDSIDSVPPSLRWLKVDSCSFASTWYSSNSLEKLLLAMENKSSVLGIISQLRIMDWTDCRSLQNLPDNISQLSHLQSLNLSGCQKLDCLPDTISDLSQLIYLNLSYCEKLRCLPENIGNLSQLEYLSLTCCKILIELPDSIGKLSQLKHLSLSWCETLRSLPESFSNLSKLEKLDVLSCYSAWKSIPYAILFKPTLCLLGLPPQVENWQKTRIAEGCQKVSSPFIRQAMAKFRSILGAECEKLDSCHETKSIADTRSIPVSSAKESNLLMEACRTPDSSAEESPVFSLSPAVLPLRAPVISAEGAPLFENPELSYNWVELQSSEKELQFFQQRETQFFHSLACSGEGSTKLETRSAPVISAEGAPVISAEVTSFLESLKLSYNWAELQSSEQELQFFQQKETQFFHSLACSAEGSTKLETRSAPVISGEGAPVISAEVTSFLESLKQK